MTVHLIVTHPSISINNNRTTASQTNSLRFQRTTTAMTTPPPEAALVQWERQQSLQRPAAHQKKLSKKSGGNPGSIGSTGSAFHAVPPKEKKVSFQELTKAQRRRLLWEVKRAHDDLAEEETTLGSLGYTTSVSTDTTSASTLTTLNTAELVKMEQFLQNPNSDEWHDQEVEEYLDKLGLGVCTLERAVVGCCPWLFCGVPEDMEEDVDVDVDVGVDKSVLGIDVSQESDDEEIIKNDYPMESNTDDINDAQKEEEEEEEKKAEDLLEHNWNLCGIHHEQEDDDDSQVIGWNGGVTIATRETSAHDPKKEWHKQKSEPSGEAWEESKPMTVAQRLAQKMGLKSDTAKSDKQSKNQVVFQDAEEEMEETHEDAIAKAEEVIRSMNLPCQNGDAMQSSVRGEICDDASEEIVTVPPTPERTTSIPSTLSKIPPSSVPSTPLKAVIVQSPFLPSTPSSIDEAIVPSIEPEVNTTGEVKTKTTNEDEANQNSIDEIEEEGIELGIDNQPPSIPSTPLKAVIPSTPLPTSTQSTPSKTGQHVNHLSTKQKFARAMMKLKKLEMKNDEDDDDGDKEKVVTSAEQPPSIPSTPLRAEIPSTPLPKSHPSSPLVGAAAVGAVSAAAVSIAAVKPNERKEKSMEDDLAEASIEEGIESVESNDLQAAKEAEQPPVVSSTPPKASIPSTPMPSSAHTPPVAEVTPSPRTSIKKKFSRAMKLKVKKDDEKTNQTDTNVDKERVTPTMATNVRGGMGSKSPNESTSVPSTPSNFGPWQVINASDLLKSKSSPSPLAKMGMLTRAMKSKKNGTQDDESEERPVNINVDVGGVKDSMVPSLPEESAKVEGRTESVEVDIILKQSDEGIENPTAPMLRLVKALSFHSQASKPQADIDVAKKVDPSQNDSDKNIEHVDSAPMKASNSPANALEPEKQTESSPSTFGLLHAVAQAMSFMTEANDEEKKESEDSPVDAEKDEKCRVDSAVAIHTGDANDVVQKDAAKPASDLKVNLDSKVEPRKSSIATQRVNNKTGSEMVGSGGNKNGASESIEYTPEELLSVKQKSHGKSSYKLRNFRSKSIGLVAKATSTKKRDMFASNETFSRASLSPVPSGTNSVSISSVAVSDYTEKVGNLSSRKQNHKVSTKKKKQKRWREYTDPNTGKKYYSNGTTTTWTKPADFAAKNLSNECAEPTPNKDQSNKQSDKSSFSKEKKANNEGSVKKSALAMLFKSSSRKGKATQPDDLSVCTDNITAHSDGNVSVISSPSKSVTNDNDDGETNNESKVLKENELEANPICENILATDCEGKVTDAMSGTPDSNDAELKPKKKKKRRKKGWREYTCPNTGNKYYSNGTITTWDKPAEFEDQNQEEEAKLLSSDNGKRVTMISFT